MNIKTRNTCRICGNPNLKSVVDLGNQYFQGSFLKEGFPLPSLRKTPNLIVRCDTSLSQDACGLIQTKYSIPPNILYANYWYQSGISYTMREHLKKIVEEALCITKFSAGNVLDIASNDNTLLRNYPSSFKKTGIDPSNIARVQNDNDIRVLNTFFPTELLSGESFDIITSIACYYDVENPRKFAEEIKKMLSPFGIWIFEVAYWPSMLRNLSYDSIVNEHIIHYHLAPLEILFASIGLKIFNVIKTSTNGGSIKVYVCHESCNEYNSEINQKNINEIRIEEFDLCLDEEETYSSFRSKIEEHRKELLKLINKIISEKKKIHIYGASTKLNTILNYCGIGPELIPYAAERSPEKYGAKTLSGIKLISEDESRAMKPDYYLVGPYHFREEILTRESKARENGAKFIFPLPKIEII